MKIKKINVTDIEGFRLGNAENAEAGTGVTVIIAENGAVGGVDVRGGGPATRETDLLKSENTVQTIDAVVLSGGSAFGLEAASGVMRALADKGMGFKVGDINVPIVSGASLFDLGVGASDVFPDREMGIEAVRNAYEGVFETGNHGAGTGATVGKILGMDRSMKTGLGSYACGDDQIKVGAIVAVNAVADVYNGAGNIIAGLRSGDGNSILGTVRILKDMLYPESQPDIRTEDLRASAVSKFKKNDHNKHEAETKSDIAKAIMAAYEQSTAVPEQTEPAPEQELPVVEEETAAVPSVAEQVMQPVEEDVMPEVSEPEVPVVAEESYPAEEQTEVSAAEIPQEVQEEVEEPAVVEAEEPAEEDDQPPVEPECPAAEEPAEEETPVIEEPVKPFVIEFEDPEVPEEPMAAEVQSETPEEPVVTEVQSEVEEEPEEILEEEPEYVDPYELSEEEKADMGYDIPFNTTIACLITNARMTKAQANKLASILHDAYARAIKPVHSTLDGDTVFVLSTSEYDVNFDAFAALATDVLQYAIIDGAISAEGAYGLPASRDLFYR